MFYRMLRNNRPDNGGQFARIEDYPRTALPWLVGESFPESPPTPLVCTLQSGGSRIMPDLYLFSLPLLSQRLVNALRAAGVDNFQDYDAALVDPDEGRPIGQYRAVNFVGRVQAVDLSKSEFDPRSQEPMLEFTSITLAEDRIGELLLFRLAENPLFIVVAESVRDALLPGGFVGLSLPSFDHPRAYY